MLYKNIGGYLTTLQNLFHFNSTSILCISGLTATCIKQLLAYLLTYSCQPSLPIVLLSLEGSPTNQALS